MELGSQKSYQLEFPGRYSFTLAKNLEISGEITKWIKNFGKTGIRKTSLGKI